MAGLGRRVLLVTVVKTWGSSPRPPGALLAVREDGIVVGSVSGGCIEDDIVERSRREGAYIHAAAGGDLRRLGGRRTQVRAAVRRDDTAGAGAAHEG